MAYYIKSWKAGQYLDWDYPVTKFEVLRAVVYDQTTTLYKVFKDELSDFEEWVAMNWACETEPQGEEEDNEAFFERMDIQIIEEAFYPHKAAQ